MTLVDELEDALDGAGDGSMMTGVAGLELVAVKRGAEQARDDRVDPLRGGEVIGDDRRSVDSYGVERERDDYPGTVLAGCTVHQDRAPRAGNRVHGADDRVGTPAQIAHVGSHHRPLVRRLLLVTCLPRLDGRRVEVGVAVGVRIQRAQLDTHAPLGAHRPRSFELGLDVGAQVDHHLERVLVHERADVPR